MDQITEIDSVLTEKYLAWYLSIGSRPRKKNLRRVVPNGGGQHAGQGVAKESRSRKNHGGTEHLIGGGQGVGVATAGGFAVARCF
jgi:hypothetical protein